MTIRILTPAEADARVAERLAAQGLPLTPDPNCEGVRVIASIVRRLIEAEKRSA